MATLSELEKQIAESEKATQKLKDQMKVERTKEATNVFNEIIKLLDGFSGYLSDEQKSLVGAYVLPPPAPGAKRGRKPNGSGAAKGPRDTTPNARLAGGEKTEFRYSGKGRKPKLLEEFENSAEGKKLLADGKPLYVAL